VLEEHLLDTAVHDRSGFDCGTPALNEYLRRFADQHRRRGISAVCVLAESSAPELILGYSPLSAAEVDAERVPEADRKRLPRYPVPCFRMGRLACRRDQQGRGLGKLLIGCAVDRCLQARRQVAARAGRRRQGRGGQGVLRALRLQIPARRRAHPVSAAEPLV
jgi:hypothetical protein